MTAATLEPYERAQRRAFDPGERVQRMVEQFVSRPMLMRVAANRFRRRPILADALVAVTGDLAPVRTLWRPLLLARLLA